MSFNKYYLPEPKELAKLIKKDGIKPTIGRKIDVMIGHSDSVKIFEAACDFTAAGLTEADAIERLSQKFPDHFNA